MTEKLEATIESISQDKLKTKENELKVKLAEAERVKSKVILALKQQILDHENLKKHLANKDIEMNEIKNALKTKIDKEKEVQTEKQRLLEEKNTLQKIKQEVKTLLYG